MLRQGVSDAEIVREATSRRLLVPLDEAAVKSLKKNGARDSLVAKLKAPGIAAPLPLRQRSGERQRTRHGSMRFLRKTKPGVLNEIVNGGKVRIGCAKPRPCKAGCTRSFTSFTASI